MHEFFARCASGFEPVLARELKSLGARQVRPLHGGAAFFGDLADAYRACLWSRVATRIQLVLARVDAHDAQALYQGALAFPWEDHLASGAAIAVQAHGTNQNLRNTQFAALKVKDALCDRLRDARGARPNVDAKDPDFALDVSVHRSKATLYLNLSGASLHRRGYRESGVQTQAPLKETLAAGILLAAGWDALCRQGEGPAEASAAQAEQGKPPTFGVAQGKASSQANFSARALFADPMCGSGTLAIEAAMIAAGIAPGLLRERWGFEGWLKHDAATWSEVVEQAEQAQRATSGQAAGPAPVRILAVAGDQDARAVELARANAERAGVSDMVAFYAGDSSELPERVVDAGGCIPAQGLLATNPPYGKRMLEQGQLSQVYEALARAIDELGPQWRLAVITPDAGIDTALGQAPSKVLECYNGPLRAGVRIYDAAPEQRVKLDVVSLAGEQHSVAVAERNSEQFAARLRKVAKERAKWARKSNVTCYRIYDADLPDYAFAIDCYQAVGGQQADGNPASAQTYIRIAEYQAPDTVDAARAERRRNDVLALVPALLDVNADRVFVKTRRHDKGGGQYRDARSRSCIVHVDEAGHTFEVDLAGRLDTGLFLDHRLTRALVGSLADGARFLNLFGYTGTATVHAAAGGAVQTTTVDMSATYLEWAQRNMAANGFAGPAHRFERADVLAWLDAAADRGETFQVIFCDPPTFSNSKTMGKRSFEVQRDHVALLQATMPLLDPAGVVVFSCNLRNFKIDEDALAAAGLRVCDITAQTIPHDFERRPKVHHAYLLARPEHVQHWIEKQRAFA